MNSEKIKKIFEEFRRKTILVIGDLMVDKYIIGKTERISPEAPVPVVDIKNKFLRLGGSGNVISNIVSLGGNVIPCGIIGDDINGDFIKEEINKSCLINKIIVDGSRPTTTKTRVFSDNQQMLRIDDESKEPIEDYYKRIILEFIKEYRYSYSGIIISDYNKGLLSDKSFVQELITLFHKYTHSIFVDPKCEYDKYYGVDFMTPNLKELSTITKTKIENDNDIYDAGMKMYHELDLKGLIVTRGKDGISVIRNDGHKMITLPTKAEEVFDVSGAGDTVIATFSLAYMSGCTMEESAEIANLAAGVVVGKVGTASATLDEILDII